MGIYEKYRMANIMNDITVQSKEPLDRCSHEVISDQHALGHWLIFPRSVLDNIG